MKSAKGKGNQDCMVNELRSRKIQFLKTGALLFGVYYLFFLTGAYLGGAYKIIGNYQFSFLSVYTVGNFFFHALFGSVISSALFTLFGAIWFSRSQPISLPALIAVGIGQSISFTIGLFWYFSTMSPDSYMSLEEVLYNHLFPMLWTPALLGVTIVLLFYFLSRNRLKAAAIAMLSVISTVAAGMALKYGIDAAAEAKRHAPRPAVQSATAEPQHEVQTPPDKPPTAKNIEIKEVSTDTTLSASTDALPPSIEEEPSPPAPPDPLPERAFSPASWHISALPGTVGPKTTRAKIVWPPMAFLDDAQAIKAPKGYQAIGAVPLIKETETAPSGWIVLAISKQIADVATLGMGLLGAGEMVLLRVLKNQTPIVLHRVSFEKEFNDPSLLGDGQLRRKISLFVAGTEMAMLSYPVTTVEDDLGDRTVFTDTKTISFAHLLHPSPKEKVSCEHGVPEFRNVDTDGKLELLCIGKWQLASNCDGASSNGCPPIFCRPGRYYLEMTGWEESSALTPAGLKKQPMLHALSRFAERTDKSRYTLRDWRDAFAVSLGLQRWFEDLMDPDDRARFSYLDSLLATGLATSLMEARGGLDTFRCLDTLDVRDPSLVDVTRAKMQKAAPLEKTDKLHGSIRWKNGALLFDEYKAAPPYPIPSWMSPDGKMRLLNITSRPNDIMLTILEEPEKNIDDFDYRDDFSLQPCSTLHNEGPFDNRSDSGGVRYVTFKGIPSDSRLADCSRHCCVDGATMWPAFGFVAWLDNSRILYAAGARFFELSVNARTAREIDIKQISKKARPFTGLTEDGQYRFFVENRNWDEPPTLWRVHLETKKFELVHLERPDPAEWSLGGDFIPSPTTWILPSPNGKQIAVVQQGEVKGIFLRIQ